MLRFFLMAKADRRHGLNGLAGLAGAVTLSECFLDQRIRFLFIIGMRINSTASFVCSVSLRGRED